MADGPRRFPIGARCHLIMPPNESRPSNRLFCFGLGYTALALAGRLKSEGWRIAGTSRSFDKLVALGEKGFEVFAFDREPPLPDAAAALAGTTHLLLSIPPDEGGEPVFDAHRDPIAALEGLAWVGYLSTTGVYGDAGGAWVDEESALAPTNPWGRRRVIAEAAWLSLVRLAGAPIHIFRLAGIYGPGRSALSRLRDGKARRIAKPDHVMSRIHVDDIVRVLQASMARPHPGAIYNVCDDEAAPQADVVAYAAEMLDVAPPPLEPFATAELSAMARSFYQDSRRVSNRRIKDELGVSLAYPSYREGLNAVLAAEPAT